MSVYITVCSIVQEWEGGSAGEGETKGEGEIKFWW